MNRVIRQAATERALRSEARKLARALHDTRTRIVFAESCTGGLLAAELARVPGISEWLCGSAVTYRDETKARWLGISRDLLRVEGAVSEAVARRMSSGALLKTPEADLAVAVTGHFGPGAPAKQSGLLFVSIATRSRGASSDEARTAVSVEEWRVLPTRKESVELRLSRQLSSSHAIFLMVRSLLKRHAR